jgi:hypothetical protein
MPTNITPLDDPVNFLIKGDLEIVTALNTDMGDGTIYVRNGGLYVEGLTDLDQTTINTGDGEFSVYGTNKVTFDMTSSIELTATTASFFKTTAGTLTVWGAGTGADGQVIIKSDGTGADSILIDALNTTDGQVTIRSAGSSTSVSSIRLLATDTTDGDIVLEASGNITGGNPAILLNATNTVSGQIKLTSAGDDASSDAISILAPGTTGGNVLIQGSGSSGDAVKIYSDNAAGSLTIQSDGTAADTITIDATTGGVLVDAANKISLQTTDTVNGVAIATVTAGIPINIGTSTSLTTISGDLLVVGSTTSLDTQNLVVTDNVAILNAGNGELGIDSGIVLRRFQDPNGSSTGDVITPTGIIQEQQTVVATGTSLPGTIVLQDYASSVDDFYKGWWIEIYAGTGAGQVRRVKSYVGATRTLTLYVTADNTAQPDYFNDGLDLAVLPDNTSLVYLYSSPYIASFYSESNDEYTLATIARPPDSIDTIGISTANIQQYQKFKSGSITVKGNTYRNVRVVQNTGTLITLVMYNNTGEIVAGDKIRITDSFTLSPPVTDGLYIVSSVSGDNVVVDVGAATTVTLNTSSVTVYVLNDSAIYVNNIFPETPGVAVNIQGLSSVMDIAIPKISTAYFNVTISDTFGSYYMLVTDISGTGASSTFALSSSGVGGSVNRLSSSKGLEGQRIDADWDSGEVIKIRQRPQGSGAGNYIYTVRIFSNL